MSASKIYDHKIKTKMRGEIEGLYIYITIQETGFQDCVSEADASESHKNIYTYLFYNHTQRRYT